MAPVVTTSSGAVQGTTLHGVHAFLGLPYAAAPVGDLRFRPPRPPERWDGTRDATAFGPVAPQLVMPGPVNEVLTPHDPAGDDCLTLNVWTPDVGAAGLPVMVWIHGGGFYSGSGREGVYRGATFARDGVVCVTLNYRLGAFGFLHVGDEGAGAYGILDQVAALEWVRANIARFGGDPARVTVAGQSAGGWSVGTLLAAPRAKGLFQRAIVMSGGAHHGIPEHAARNIADDYCTALGTSRRDLDALQALPDEAIVGGTMGSFGQVFLGPDVDRHGLEVVTSGVPFMPTYGGDVVPTRPIDAIEAGAAAGVDLLVGHTADEFRLFLLAGDPTPSFVEGFGDDDWVDACFELAFPGRGGPARERYRAGRPGDGPFELLSALGGDQQFRIPAVCLADAQARHAQVFAYQFSWPSSAFEGTLGPTHCVDLGFVWDSLDDEMSLRITGPEPPSALADAMHRAWVGFVTDGTPDHADVPEWPVYDGSRPVMDFGEEVTVVHDPGAEVTAEWEGDPLRRCNPRGASIAGWS